MSHPYPQEMYGGYSANRSPGRQGDAYGSSSATVNRQPSRHFDTTTYTPSHPGPMGLYTAEDHAARYDSAPRFDRIQAPPSMGGGYPPSAAAAYDNQTWNYGGATGAQTMGVTGRMKSSNRRGGIPTVSPFTKDECQGVILFLTSTRAGLILQCLLRACTLILCNTLPCSHQDII